MATVVSVLAAVKTELNYIFLSSFISANVHLISTNIIIPALAKHLLTFTFGFAPKSTHYSKQKKKKKENS